jgi:hypothetical protein
MSSNSSKSSGEYSSIFIKSESTGKSTNLLEVESVVARGGDDSKWCISTSMAGSKYK